MSPTLHLPRGSASNNGDPVALTPADAGWQYCGLHVLDVPAGSTRTLVTGDAETVLLPLSGEYTVECDGRSASLEGRAGVFERVTDFAYVPIDAEARLRSTQGGTIAAASARATRRLDFAYGPAGGVPIEVRGAGPATRQVNNFLAPGAFEADKLMAVEVLTPAANWSSYPPHKHDECRAGEVELEEIYYFEIAPAHGHDGFGFHRVYTHDGEIDFTATVASGDVVLVPRGYHGPSVAAPQHDMYYLNVLAGPGHERAMSFCDDPRYAWVRDAWGSQPPDPRVPMTTAEGRR